MKKMIVSALMLGVLTLGAFAQDKNTHNKKTPEEKAQLMTDKMDQKLRLTATQKSQVYKLNLESAKERNLYKHNAKDKPDATARQSFKEHMKSRDEKLNSILNDEQRNVYQQYKQEHKKHKGHHKASDKKN